MKKQKQTTPMLRFPDFQDDWISETLGNYFNFKNGVNADKSAYGRGHKFINVLDIISDIPLVYDRILDSVDISDDEFKKNEVLHGDILFQRSSETREEVGQSNVYIDAHKPATFGGFVIRGRPIKEQVPQYFHYLLKTTKSRKDMTARSGGSTRYNIGQESLSDVSVNVAPTLPEQQKIAEFLGTVDEKIIQLQKKKTLLEDYKKCCMQKLFSQELRFKGDNGNPLPIWEERKLSDVAEIITGKTPSTTNENLWGGDIQFITPTDIYDDTMFLKTTPRHVMKTKAIRVLPKNTICYTCIASIGKSCLTVFPAITNQQINSAIVIKPHNPIYVFYALEYMTPKIKALQANTTLPIINKTEFSKIKIPAPHPDEQKKIADFLSAIDDKIALVSEEMDKAKSFKKGLLQQMFV